MKEQQEQITVFLGCLIKDGKVLMIQRDEEECPEAHLKWELPGGKVNFGETPQEATSREFLEETGIKIRVREILPHVQVNYWDYLGGCRQQTLVLCFRCELIEEGPIQQDHQVREIKWVKLQEIDQTKILPGIQKFVELSVQRLKNGV